MMKKIIITVFLILFLFSNLFAQESEIGAPQREKSIFLGILLGSVGFAGILVPGTYGWGNFYAEDRTALNNIL